MKNDSKVIYFVQILLTLFGTILAFVMLCKTFESPTLLGILGAITYFTTYIAIIVYTTINYKKEKNIYFQGVIYAFAAVMGIQILQSGNYMADYGLTQNLTILINCCNLISFANIIKFADNLNVKKTALSYITIAVLLKLIVEIYLIIKMVAFIQFIHILMSLSIPILGVIILLIYIYRNKRINQSL